MFIKDDFQSGAPITQVPVCWFNSVAKFLNNLIPGEGIRFDKHDNGAETAISIRNFQDMGTPTDNTGANVEESEPNTLTFTAWTAGGENGVKLRLYCLVDSGNGEHTFHPLDIDIAASGLVKSIAMPSGNHGVWVGA